MALMVSLQDNTPLVASAAAVVAAMLLWRRWAATSASKPLRTIHTLPDAWPLLGDLVTCLRHEARFHDWLSDTSLHFCGEPWRVRNLGQQDMVVVCTPEAFDAVLSSHFGRVPKRRVLQRGALRRLWTLDRDTRRRRLASPAQDRNQILHDQGPTHRDGPDYAQERASNTFAEIGLGVDVRWMGQSDPNPIEEAVHLVSPVIMRRFRVPAWWWQLEQFVGFGPEKTMADAMATVQAWIGRIIDDSLTTFAKRQVDGHVSAHALALVFLLLTQHPDIKARIRDEMERNVGAHETFLTTDHVHHLVYLEATIRETFRLYSPLPLKHKEAAEDTVVCGDILIRKGESVCLSAYAMARNPNVWGPDAAEFKPERWIDPVTGTLISVPPSKFAAFGAGPRMCVGMKLALMELRVVAANLLHRYHFSLAAPNDGDYIVGITLSLKHPLHVNATRA